METHTDTQLADLLRELERQRAAVREYRLSVYPEKQALHELKLLSLYVEIGNLCRAHGLNLPSEVRGLPRAAPG